LADLPPEEPWGRNGGEQFGWWLHKDEEHRVAPESADGTYYTEAYLAFYPLWPAGYLARCIATHSEGES
jgi:hypothetical protein